MRALMTMRPGWEDDIGSFMTMRSGEKNESWHCSTCQGQRSTAEVFMQECSITLLLKYKTADTTRAPTVCAYS